MAKNEIKPVEPVVKWGTDPAPTSPNFGTVGRTIGEATARALADGSFTAGLGTHVYPRRGQLSGGGRIFNGDFGVYTRPDPKPDSDPRV